MKKTLFICLAVAALTAGCDDLFTPAVENIKELEDGRTDPQFAEGILANAYTRNPYNAQSFNDVATDDAVTNQTDNTYLLMATGSWTANNNPVNQWDGCKAAIQYINMFLSEVEQTSFAKDSTINRLFRNRLKGEAYGLRAMNMFYLLQAHAGWTDDGRLLGVPVVNEMETATSDFNRPRNTFDECIQAIYDDDLRLLVAGGALCSNARLLPPEEEGGRYTVLGDPTEACLLVAAQKAGVDPAEQERAWPRVRELPFESRRKRMTTVHQLPEELDGARRVAFVKGAPTRSCASRPAAAPTSRRSP